MGLQDNQNSDEIKKPTDEEENPADLGCLRKGWDDDELEIPGDFGQQFKQIALKAQAKKLKTWQELPQSRRDFFLKDVEEKAAALINYDTMAIRAGNGYFDLEVTLDLSTLDHSGFIPPSAKTISQLSFFEEWKKEYAADNFEFTVEAYCDFEDASLIDMTMSWANADLDNIKE